MMNSVLLKLLMVYLGARPVCAAPALLTRGPGAEAAALGRTAVSVVQDPTALYWNPAGLAGAGGAVTGEHLFLYDGARYDFVGLSVPSKVGTFGLGALQLHRGNITARRTIDDPGTRVAASQANYLAGFARRFGEFWSGGATLSVLDYNLAGYRDRGFGVDVGGRFSKPSEDWAFLRRPTWSAAAVIKHLLQPSLKLDQEEESHPRDLRAGMSVSFDGFSRLSLNSGSIRKDRAMVGLGVSKVVGETELRAGFGAAYTLQDVLTLRLALDDGFAVGMGLKTVDGRFGLDYALENRTLAKNHRFTLTYRFSKPTTRSAEHATEQRDEDYLRVKSRAEALGGEALARGKELFKGQQYESAADSLLAASLLRTDDAEARELHQRASEVSRRDLRQRLRDRLDQQVTAQDNLGAYRTLARLLRVAPEDKERLVELGGRLYARLQPEERDGVTEELLATASEEAELALSRGLHAKALAEVEWLKVVVDSASASAVESAVTQTATTGRARLVKEISDARAASDARLALVSAEALKLAYPGDAAADQAFQAARSQYLAELKLTNEERLYVRKLYFLAAVLWAKKDADRTRELLTELRRRDASDQAAARLMALVVGSTDMTDNGGVQ